MRIVFCGTGAFGAPSLRALHAARLEIACVVTQPDRPAGRSKDLRASPIKLAAEELGLPVAQPERLSDPAGVALLAEASPDALVVISYGQILRAPVLALPRLGCLNVHGSLLPRHRGASPIHAALLHGDAASGVTVIRMDAGVDTGPIVVGATDVVRPRDTFTSLHDRLAALGASIIASALEGVANGTIVPRPQPEEGATRCRILKKEDGRLEWSKSAIEIDRAVRALNPWPGTRATLVRRSGAAVELTILEAEPSPVPAGAVAPGGIVLAKGSDFVVACGEGTLAIRRVKPSGRNDVDVAAFLRGHPVMAGDTFQGSAS